MPCKPTASKNNAMRAVKVKSVKRSHILQLFLCLKCWYGRYFIFVVSSTENFQTFIHLQIDMSPLSTGYFLSLVSLIFMRIFWLADFFRKKEKVQFLNKHSVFQWDLAQLRHVSSVFRFVSSSLLTYFLNRLFWMSSNMATILFSTSSSGIVTFAPVSLLTVTHWRCCISLGPTSRRIGTPCMRHRHTWIEITKRVRTILQVKYFINDHHYIMVIIILFMTLSSQWLNFHPGE